MNESVMKKVMIAVVVAIAIIALLIGGRIGFHIGREAPVAILPDTIVLHTVDTLRVQSPPDTITSVVVKKLRVPVVQIIHDTIHDIVVDSADISLPFEQHHIKVEDVADVWVNGYGVTVDSCVAYRPHTTEIVNHTISTPQPKNMVIATAGAKDASLGYMRRFGPVWVGVSAGYTYDGTPTVRGSLGYQF